MTADIWWPNSYNSNYVYETQEEYVERVYDEILDTFQARFRSLSVDGSVISDSLLYKATDLYRPDGLRPRNITTVATFDLNGNQAGPADRASVMTGDGRKFMPRPIAFMYFRRKFPPRMKVVNFFGMPRQKRACGSLRLMATATLSSSRPRVNWTERF